MAAVLLWITYWLLPSLLLSHYKIRNFCKPYAAILLGDIVGMWLIEQHLISM
jgi:hypothetical protein